MIVHFHDLNILQLALTTGAVPPDVAQKPAVAGFDDEEQIWIETAAKLPASAQRELKRLGVLVCKSSRAALNMEVSCWLELLPLVRDRVPLDALEKVPVLFDVPSGAELSRLVLEMLRLSNDRQSYRWLQDMKDSTNGRALLRVVGPPYYTLLRAIDRLGGPEIAPHAFVEAGAGVWVEVGYRHPLAANIKLPKGRILLLRPPRQWLMLPDAPFRDIYETFEFQIAGSATQWKDHSLPHRLTVVPRLRQAGPADGAELWVLRSGAIEQLNRFVQNAADHLLDQLAFAVGEKDGQTIVILRVRQTKLPPPVLVLSEEAYKRHLKLPNLFLPAGSTLHPPLRRDVVRKLLAEDPGQITWLAPGENGLFTPETLPDDGFRPLTDWVDYVLECDREQLRAWMQAMQFEFEPFICDEDQPRKPKKLPSSEKTRGPKDVPARRAVQRESGETTAFEAPTEAASDIPILEELATLEKTEPSEVEKELHAIEEEFLALPGGLDEAARRALWPRLANLNARLSKWEDAGICWLNALWDAGDNAEKWTAAWFRAETQSALRGLADGGQQVGDDLDRLLAMLEPASADLRTLAAYLAWSARREPRPAALIQRLQALQHFLEKHEKLLPVRACWLAWYHLAQLTDGDVLTLARARDRLLERLFQNGLRLEQDLPSFLRFAGQPYDRRGRGMKGWMLKMRESAHRWVDRQCGQGVIEYKEAKTKEYVDLLFAFGLARLGEHDASRQLLVKAQGVLDKEDEAHAILFRLFESRIRQAMEGQAPNTALESEVLERIRQLRRIEQAHRVEGRKGYGPPLSYVIDKMRETSRILEPLQKPDAYRYMRASESDEVEQALARLPDIKDRKELAEQIEWLLKKGTTSLPLAVRILKGTLEQSPRVGEETARQLLEQSLRAYDQLFSLPADDKGRPGPGPLMDLLERGLFVAAHFGRLDAVQALMTRFRQLLREEREPPSLIGFDHVIEQCLRGLRKLGLRDEIQVLLALVSDAVLKGRTPARLLADKDAGRLGRTLLSIAAGWYDFGRDSLAEPVFQAARTLLLQKKLVPTEHLALACAYAKALGAAPIATIQQRVEELFAGLEGIPIMSSYGNYYSPSQIKFVEAVVLAVVGNDFTQGAQAQRWLEDDEYVVRQRIHSDIRRLMG